MVIDDSRAMRKILRRTLDQQGFEVVEAGDGQEALEMTRADGAPSLALVDWNMPVMDGLEFVTTLRSYPEYRDVTLMMVTTEGEYSQIVRALTARRGRGPVHPGRHARQADGDRRRPELRADRRRGTPPTSRRRGRG